MTEPNIVASIDQVTPRPRKASPKAQRIIFGYQGSQRFRMLTGILFALLGALAVVIFSVNSLRVGSNWSAYLTTTAKILSVEEHLRRGQPQARVVYRYQLGGRDFDGAGTLTKLEDVYDAEVGGTLSIDVSRNDPSASRIAGSGNTQGYLFPILISAFFALLGLGLLFFTTRENRREIWAYTYGIPTTARVSSHGPDKTWKQNGKHPYKVAWEFEVAGKPYQGSLSSMEEETLTPYTEAPEIIVVYDQDNPQINTLYIP